MNRNLTAIILIVLGIGIYFTYTQGQIEDIKAIQSVNSQYANAISNAEQLIKARDKVLTQFNNISDEDKDRLEKMLPESVDNIRLIIDLNSVAIKHGFNLKDIRAKAQTGNEKGSTNSTKPTANANVNTDPKAKSTTKSIIPTSTLDTISVSFGVTAPYQEFISFLQDLEANLRIMDISKLTLSANDGGTYDFKVELKTYWLRQ